MGLITNNQEATAQWECSSSANNRSDMLKKPILTVVRVIAMFWIFLALSACNRPSKPIPERAETTQRLPQPVKRELAIKSYNYTAKYIDSFNVGPVDGGNVHLSSETGGGGGIVCCFSFQRDVGPKTVKVEWTDDLCKYNVRALSNGETDFAIHSEVRTRSVEIATPIPNDPQYLEVHFYPDGTVQAAITEAISPPRILLSKSRRKPMPICPNNNKPT